MDQQYLNNYFSQYWRGQLNQYLYSGVSLKNKISPDEWVLDVGCGINPFKSIIANLIGIDPAFGQADYQTTIEDFETDQRFDVAFCLGSINFGSEDNIKNQIKCVNKFLNPKARIYWRCNPGLRDHGNPECQKIDFFPWSSKLLNQYAKEFGFRVVVIKEDFYNRIYCEWARAA
jgi:hypothetical protein